MEHEHIHPPEPMHKKHRTQLISLFVGGLLVILGLCGILFSSFAGLHLSIYYSLIILVAGGLLFYNGGFKNNSRYAFACCFIFAIFFGLNALAGWVFGRPGIPEVGYQAPDPVLIKVIPNFYELGRNDHILNTLLAVFLGMGAFDWWKKHSQRGHRTEALKQTFDKLVHH